MDQKQDQDALYQEYDKNLYKLTGTEMSDDIINMLNADPSANNSSMVNVPADSMGSGIDTSTTSGAAGSSYQGGKQTFDNTAPGYILGIDQRDGLAKFYIGNSTKYINWDGSNLTVVGGLNVSSLNIPDLTTAASFHVDATGIVWLGANVATGYTGANIYMLPTGHAVFKDISIGGTAIQYVITNSGIFSYGDGNDGSATCDGSTAVAGMTRVGSVYTMTRDVYFTTLTINNTVTVKTGGYRLFCSVSLTVTGTIDRSGNAGSNGQDFNAGHGPGAGGVALATGYLIGSYAGADGGGGGSNTPGGVGVTGTAAPNSLGSNGSSGGVGAPGTAVSAGGAGPGGTATAANVRLTVGVQLATLLDVGLSGSTIKYNSSAAAGGGGGGGGDGSGVNFGGGGGGGASAGGIIAIYAKILTINGGGIIQANGANGGNGGNGNGAPQGGGGGGAGSNGGIIILVYNQLTNSGSITTTAGLGGSPGGGGNGSSATAGGNGTGGITYNFQLSL